MKQHLSRMLESMFWADQRSFAAIRNVAETQHLTLPLFGHILAAEHVWLTRLQGKPLSMAVFPDLDIDSCQNLASENRRGFLEVLENQDDDRLLDDIVYRDTSGVEHKSKKIDILTHVVIHGAYHRGQIAKAIGRDAVNTDYITFVRSLVP